MTSPAGGWGVPRRRFWVRGVPAAAAGPLAVAALMVVTRLPLRTRYLLNWDAAQFALGLRQFDVVHHQPHPPGYPGYELVGHLLLRLGGDANSALIALSITGEVVAAVLIFWFARTLFGTGAGWISALALVSSPLYWYYGEAADTYALEPPIVLAVAWLCWRTWSGGRREAILAAAVLSLGGSLRPSTAVFLSPLLAGALLRLGSRATTVAAVGTGLALTAGWAVPLLILAGGPAGYLRSSVELGGSVTSGTAIWRAGLDGAQTTAAAVLRGTVWELGILVVPLLFGLVMAPRLSGRPLPTPPGWIAFCGLWALPALATFLLVHIGQVAYVQVFMPALFLSLGPALVATCTALGRPNWQVPIATAALAANACLFFAPPSTSLAGQLGEHDRQVAALITTVAAYDPQRTALVLDAYASGNYRTAQVYLPDYQRVAVARDDRGQLGEIFGDIYSPERLQHSSPLQFKPGVDTFIFPDVSVTLALVADPSRFETRRMAAGGALRIWRGAPPTLHGGLIWLGSPFANGAPLLP